MRDHMGVKIASKEPRNRLEGIPIDTRKRYYYKNTYSLKENKKFGNYHSSQGQIGNFRTVKLILVFITCGSFMTLFSSPNISTGQNLAHSRRLGFSKIGWLWGSDEPDSGYKSNLKIDWKILSKAIDKIKLPKETLKVGFLNFNQAEFSKSQTLLSLSKTFQIRLDQSNSSWDELFPEWIDEEGEYSIVPKCPKLPGPGAPPGMNFNLIIVKLPCRNEANWSRDVARLHLQLTAVKIAVNGFTAGEKAVHILILSKCFPIPNLFKCKRLVMHERNVWLYKPDLNELIEKLHLPIGSCELALPFKEIEKRYLPPKRVAYATILHSENSYVCGAISAAQSIKMSGSRIDLIILIDESITLDNQMGLEASGWKIRFIKRIRNPKAEPESYNEWNYSKFWLWNLTDYDKIVFIDSDLLILRNIDILFSMPEIAATGNDGALFNSGIMVIEPCECTFNLLMDHINDINSYNGGDQGYLNEIFPYWHRIPLRMNYLKHFWEGDTDEIRERKTGLFGSEPAILYTIHYLGIKPWLCFRDYDCNFNVKIQHEFASDVAHFTWWRFHDKMPKYLQSFCLLSENQKEVLKVDLVNAKLEDYTDGHFRRSIKDPRIRLCSDEICIEKKKKSLNSFVM
ncbi:hypothetical protein LUZ60_004564 [Juncus effusus]|nr:hypothetical protein LUZ60_004564 [Juncus effusus]